MHKRQNEIPHLHARSCEPDTSDFGIDYDGADLDPGSAFKLCGPPGSIEIPDDGWPVSGRGNSIAFGTPISGDILFPVYVFQIDGGSSGSFFATTTNPRGGYASFVDDESPPSEDRIQAFGTVRWFAQGSNECPTGSDSVENDHVLEGDVLNEAVTAGVVKAVVR